MKRSLSVVLSALTFLSVAAVSPVSAQTKVSADFQLNGSIKGTKLSWQIKDKTLYIKGKGALPDFVDQNAQPWYSSVSQYSSISISKEVTSIGKNAFSSNTNVTSFKVAEDSSLKSVGEYAFSGCSALKKVTLPGVKSLASYSFANCTVLNTIDAPNAEFDKYVFLNSSKVSTVNAGTLADEAFYGCSSLKNVSLKNAEKIGERALSYCTHITSVSSDAVSVGKEAFLGCTNLTYVKLPNAVRIPESAFAQLPNLKTVKLGKVESIGKTAFYDCPRLKNLTGTENVKTIAGFAFSYCYKLTKFPSSKALTYVGKRAFFDCRTLKGDFNAENITRIGDFAFGNCRKLSSSMNFTKVKQIGMGAFSYCLKLRSNSLGQKVKKVSDYAFAGCKKITHIFVPPVCRKLGYACFAKATRFRYTSDGGYTFSTMMNDKFTIYGKRHSYAQNYAYSKNVKCKFRVAVEKIKVQKSSISLKAGQSYKIKASTSPSNARFTALSYKSSSSKIASVNSSGYITANTAGECIVTLTTKDGSRVTAQIKVNVK